MFRYFENLVDPYLDYPEDDRPPVDINVSNEGYIAIKDLDKVRGVDDDEVERDDER